MDSDFQEGDFLFILGVGWKILRIGTPKSSERFSDRVTAILNAAACNRGSYREGDEVICGKHGWTWPEGQEYCNVVGPTEEPLNPEDMDSVLAQSLAVLLDLRTAGLV